MYFNKKKVTSDYVFTHIMFTHRKERAEILEALIVSKEDTAFPNFHKNVLIVCYCCPRTKNVVVTPN